MASDVKKERHPEEELIEILERAESRYLSQVRQGLVNSDAAEALDIDRQPKVKRKRTKPIGDAD